jgi:hypothetical protein
MTEINKICKGQKISTCDTEKKMHIHIKLQATSWQLHVNGNHPEQISGNKGDP